MARPTIPEVSPPGEGIAIRVVDTGILYFLTGISQLGAFMYLRQIFVKNSGPIRSFEHAIDLDPDSNTPRPTVLVGPNGAGKTTLLSIIVDSFYEAAALHFTDTIPGGYDGITRPWFRIVGPWTSTHGEAGVSVLEYEHDDAKYAYVERSGTLSDELTQSIPESMRPALGKLSDELGKIFAAPEEAIRTALSVGSLLYFPSSRSEVPHWLNEKSLGDLQFDAQIPFAKILNRPIYVDRGLDKLEQWMMALLLDTRADFVDARLDSDSTIAVGIGDLTSNRVDQRVWAALNSILRVILDDESVNFVSGHRRSAVRIGFNGSDGRSLPLGALSSGQATLLNIFGTLMRYADRTTTGALPEDVKAICLIDEIDAHMHVDLQHRALPALMRLFPRVQFIVSSHSPLFALGVDATFPGTSSASLLQMPDGLPIQAEAYSEFERAMAAFHETKRSNELVVEHVQRDSTSDLLVLCEGETDPLYLTVAIDLLSEGASLRETVDIEWIGKKDESGNAFNTGKDALNSTAKLLRAKPGLVNRPLLLLYDNDTNKQDEQISENVFVRAIPTNHENAVVTAGIENLLPENVFVDDTYDTSEKKKPNGDVTTVRSLKKMELCRKLCDGRETAVFSAFATALAVIEAVRTLVSPGVPPTEGDSDGAQASGGGDRPEAARPDPQAP